jgi:hypothetical protein
MTANHRAAIGAWIVVIVIVIGLILSFTVEGFGMFVLKTIVVVALLVMFAALLFAAWINIYESLGGKW